MKYVCKVCGYVYDEATQGVPFDRLPAEWLTEYGEEPAPELKSRVLEGSFEVIDP